MAAPNPYSATGTPYSTQTQATATQNPWDPNAFQQVVGRAPTSAETQYYSNAGPNWLDEVKGNTPDYTQRQQQQQQSSQASGPWGGAPNLNGWIDQQLQGVSSSDDPSYWYSHIANDPKAASGDPSALAYWADRIRRGNGSALVKSGQLQLFNDSPSGGGGGGSFGAFTGTGSLMSGAPGVGNANSLYAQLLGRSQQSLSFDPRTDAIMRPQIDAFSAAQQQQNRNTLAQAAEAGGPNNNLNAETRSLGEAAGQATAGFQAGLAQNELNARRTEIQQALSGMQGLLTSEQQLALQEELSNLDRAQQESQFGRQLANNAYQFDINDQYRNSPLAWA